MYEEALAFVRERVDTFESKGNALVGLVEVALANHRPGEARTLAERIRTDPDVSPAIKRSTVGLLREANREHGGARAAD